jgi:hypothetical protein
MEICAGRKLHGIMVHTIADLALLFYNGMRRVLAIVICRSMYIFYLVVLVGINHILARNKAKQQCPGIDNMVSAFFHNYL